MGKYRVMIIGCGNLGSRHLQAVASLEDVGEVCVVDISQESLDLGKKRLGEVMDLNRSIKFSWETSLDDVFQEADLCIVATLASQRPALVKEIAASKRCKKFLIEKIVAQSVIEYEGLLQFSDKFNLSVWVNCQSRSYKIHKYIKSLLNPQEPIFLHIVGGNRGLACVGLHYADLFVFFDNTEEISGSAMFIDETLHPSKRSKDIYELSGVLMGNSSRGSSLLISYNKFDIGPDCLLLATPSRKFVIDQYNKLTVFESVASSGWEWKKIAIEEEYLVSKISRGFISSILCEDKCDLPTLSECFPAHKFILSSLLPYYNKLLGRESSRCPVT